MKPVLDTFERMGIGIAIFDRDGCLLSTNATGRLIFVDLSGELNIFVQTYLRSFTRAQAKNEIVSISDWVFVHAFGEKQVALHLVPTGPETDPLEQIMLIAVGAGRLPSPSIKTLKKVFGLTAAEADLAIAISRGASPAHIAASRHVSLPTVRTQLASVFAKTQSRRQADLVATLASLSVLP